MIHAQYTALYSYGLSSIILRMTKTKIMLMSTQQALLHNLRLNLSRLLEEKSMTHDTLVQRSGVSRRSITSIMSEKGNPTIKTIADLGQTMRVPAWTLLMPPEEFQAATKYEQLLKNYCRAGASDRKMIDHITQRVAEPETPYET